MSWRMPGEYEPHSGCIMIWPERPGSWPYGAAAARRAFARVAEVIARSEQVYMLMRKELEEEARAMLPPEVQILSIETDDAWARDVAPTFVVNGQGGICGIDWAFNAWGGMYNGLYPHYEKDDAAAAAICTALHVPRWDLHPFVAEGGAIHTDGEGTLLVTVPCLLSPGRNPMLTREETESLLCRCLGAKKVLWLPHGIYGDETDEHVDNAAAFVRPGELVLAWTDNPDDPQYAWCREDLAYLQQQTDAAGRQLQVHLLPLPAEPVCVTEEEVRGYTFAPGEAEREPGERLAASYVNFYLSNDSVVMPAFGDVQDAPAAELLQTLFPERTVVPVPAREILLGGGGIHCITQQIPKGGGSRA